MNIVVDENVALSVVEYLQKEGYQVKRIAEIAQGCPDSEVLEITRHHNALLLTEDKDFGELVLRYQGRAPGVLLVRLERVSRIERSEMIAQVIRDHGEKLLNAFTVLSSNVLRMRFYE